MRFNDVARRTKGVRNMFQGQGLGDQTRIARLQSNSDQGGVKLPGVKKGQSSPPGRGAFDGIARAAESGLDCYRDHRLTFKCEHSQRQMFSMWHVRPRDKTCPAIDRCCARFWAPGDS